MTYQIIYSSNSTMPMQADDLEELLEHSRAENGSHGISGALVYADGIFLQILEGERSSLEALMTRIRRDVRHEKVTMLREGEIPAAQFSSWKMAYLSATPEQVASWAGIGIDPARKETIDAVGQDRLRTAQFAQDILALLAPEESGEPVRERDVENGSGAT